MRKTMPDPQTIVQEAARSASLGTMVSPGPGAYREVSLSIIEEMKREVDRQIRVDATEALKLAECTYELSLLVENPLARALGLRARAQALHVLGRYVEAIELYEEASKIYRAVGSEVEAARIGRSMIDALMYLGRYDEALEIAGEARRTLVTHGERLLAAQLETNVGNVYHRLDQYHQALAYYERAADVFALTGEAVPLAVVSFNRANIYSSLDEFRQSQALYEQAYEIYQSQGMMLAATQVKYSIGYLHFLKGEYHQAMRIFHEVDEDFARLGDERMGALCDLDLAEIYLQLNILDEAAELGARARARFERIGMGYEAAKAHTFWALAALRQGKVTEAEAALHQVRAEFANENNEVFQGVVGIYLAELSLKRREGEKALAQAREAEALFVHHGLKARTCSAQLVVARALQVCGRCAEARAKCEESLAGSQELEVSWLKQQAHELLGDLLLEDGEAQSAYENYVRAVAFVEQIRSGIRVDEFRSAFFKDKLRVYDKLIRLCLRQGGAEKEAEAFYYLESRKARTLVDLMVNELDPIPPANGAASSDWEKRWRRLREELHWYYSKVHQRELDGKQLPVADQKNLHEEIRVRERQLVEMTRLVQMRDPNFFWLRNVSGMLIDELRSNLAADEAVIEYYFDGDDLVIFVIDQGQFRVIRGLDQRQNLKDLILELKLLFEKFHYGQPYLEVHQENLLWSANGCLQELYDALFAPVAELVAGRKLIFVPFDILHNVPFQALYDGELYLIDRHEVAFAPSARLYALCLQRSGREQGRMLLIGAADEVAPRIAEEIEAIRGLYPEARCFTGAEADLQALTSHAGNSDVLHIACHAILRQDNPMFSAFRLANNWLNFYDVCSLRLPSAMVILSGCSTGANRTFAGDEILGLVRGFLSAGAASLIVSLWDVNDPATAKLMEAFYERVKAGVSARQALREAALKARQLYAHPYYWAPFVFIGRG